MPAVPVVFVHGLIGTFQVPDLAGHFQNGAIAPDLLGYGAAADVAVGEINLPNQVAYLHEVIASAFGGSAVHIVGHSVGGVVAALFAHTFPARVKSFVNVEGNFTRKDAFWSASVARMSETDANQMLAGFRQDPADWLARDGIPATPEFLEIASYWLHHQPASTVRAMAKSVVQITSEPGYLPDLRAVFAQCPVHLVAGERSRHGWDVQDWALDESASLTIQPGTGHMMMLEDTHGFVSILRRLLEEPAELATT
jgi:lipase